MATATGYGFRKKLTLSNSSLTDYVSAPEDGIIVNAGAGTDSAANVYLGGNAQDSFIDVVLTDDADNIIPFEWAYRKPGDYGKLIWSKTSVAANQELYLYYGKASATYEGADVGTFVERWQDYDAAPVTNNSHDDVTRSNSIAFGQRATSAEVDGFVYQAWSQDQPSSSNPETWIRQYDLFTRAEVARYKLGNVGDDDPHSHPSTLVDSSGYVHVWVPRPNHANGAIYWKSTNPHDVTAWPSAAEIGATNQHEGGYYFQPILRPNGDIWLFFRDRDFWYISSTDGGATWSAATSVISESTSGTPGTNDRVYGWVSVDPATNDILISYSYSDASAGYEDLGFVYYDHSASAWKAADGTTITLPAISTDATFIENSAGADRMTNGFGPFITAAGEFAFFYAFNGAWDGTDIRLKRWNGTSWDEDTITITDLNGPGVIAWEDGSTKHLVARIKVSATRYDWREFTASTWGGTWTGGTYIFENEGTLTDIDIPYQMPTGVPLIMACDADSDNIWFRDPDAPAYSRTWTTAGDSTPFAGAGYCRVIADQADSYLITPLSTLHSTFRADFGFHFYEMGSSDRSWYSVVAVQEDLDRYNATGNDCIQSQMRGPATPDAMEWGVSILDGGTFHSVSIATGRSPQEHHKIALTYDESTAGVEVYDDDYGTLVDSGTSSHSMTRTLDVIGFSQAVSGSTDTTQSAKYLLGQIRYYEDQTASAPTYDTWGSEETAPFPIDVPTGSVTYTGQAPTVTASDHITVTVPVGSLSYTGNAPTVTADASVSIEVPTGSVSYTGQVPTVTANDNISIEVPVGSMTYTGLAPSVSVASSVNITVPVGSVTYTGLAPSISASSGKVGVLEFKKPLSTALEFKRTLH